MLPLSQSKKEGQGQNIKVTPPSLVALSCFVACSKIETNLFFYSIQTNLRKKLFDFFQTEEIFKKLEYLDFSVKPDKDHHSKQLTDEEIRCLSNLKNLRSLQINNCHGLSAISLCHISELTNLTKLYLSGCPQAAHGLPYLKSSKSLKILDLSFCEVQDPMMQFVGEIKSLIELNLMCNRLGDEGCTHLLRLNQIEKLNIAMNPQITDKTILSFFPLSKLSYLNISFCRLVSRNAIEKLISSFLNLNVEFAGCDSFEAKAKKPLILLAEDSEVQARMISLVLNRYDFDVEIARNGEIALEMFQANSDKYDLILMDICMPKMDGISCVKKIRDFEKARKKKHQTPIILQTGTIPFGGSDNTSYFRTEFNCEILKKPLDKACILLAKQLMEHKRKRSNTDFPQRASMEELRKLSGTSESITLNRRPSEDEFIAKKRKVNL